MNAVSNVAFGLHRAPARIHRVYDPVSDRARVVAIYLPPATMPRPYSYEQLHKAEQQASKQLTPEGQGAKAVPVRDAS